jgi:hypothetical protein
MRGLMTVVVALLQLAPDGQIEAGTAAADTQGADYHKFIIIIIILQLVSLLGCLLHSSHAVLSGGEIGKSLMLKTRTSALTQTIQVCKGACKRPVAAAVCIVLMASSPFGFLTL